MNTPRDPIDRFFDATLRLSHLRMLASLADLRQVRRVAEAFNVTQSAISKQLAEIETGLGEPVVRREGNGLVLTPIGQQLTLRATEVLQQLDRARGEILSLRKGLGGRVVIGAVATVNSDLVPKALLRLKERAPAVVVALEEDTADRLLPRLVDRRIDLAVVRMWHPLVHRDLVHKVLMDEAIVIAVGAQHPLAGQSAVSWQDAMAHPWIVPKAGSPAHGALEALVASHGHRIPDGTVESISFALNLALFACAPFVGLLPERTAKVWAREGRIAVLPLDTDRLLSEVRVFWRTDDKEPALGLMLECLESAANSSLEDRPAT